MSQMLIWRRSIGWIAQTLGRGISYVFTASAVAVLVMQLVDWLRDGHWTSISSADGVLWLTSRAPPSTESADLALWVHDPSTWLGLHTLFTLIPLALGLLGIGILGTLIQDRGRSLRLNAEHQIWAEKQLDHAPAGPASRTNSPSHAPESTQIEPQLSDAWHALEREVLRWLAVNGTDRSVSTPAAMARHLGKPVAAIEASIETLERFHYIKRVGEAAALADRGFSFCIEQGWTMRA